MTNPAHTPVALDVDVLAQEIRRVDGNNELGAAALAEAIMPFLRAYLSAVGGEAGEKPYAYEFGRSNGDDTYSVFIERSLPAKPHPDWPVKPLYASPQPANPAQVTDAWLVTNGPDGQCAKVVVGFDNLKLEVVAAVFGDGNDDSEEAQDMRDRLDTPGDWEGDRWSMSWSFEDGYLNVQRISDLSALTAAIGAGSAPDLLPVKITDQNGTIRDAYVDRTEGKIVEADAENLGRFGHHPDPAIDFEVEVEILQSRLIDAKAGLSEPGTEPETVAAVLEDIQRAMMFQVGGDPSAVRAKQMLREIENDAVSVVGAGGHPATSPITEGEPSDAEVERASQAVVAEWKKMAAEMHPHLSVSDAARSFVSPGNYRLIRAVLLAAKSKGGQADG